MYVDVYQFTNVEFTHGAMYVLNRCTSYIRILTHQDNKDKSSVFKEYKVVHDNSASGVKQSNHRIILRRNTIIARIYLDEKINKGGETYEDGKFRWKIVMK